MSTLRDRKGKGCMIMWKKLGLTLITLLGCISIGLAYLNTDMNAASLNRLNEGEQVIVGVDDDGEEAVWTISKDNGTYYAMYYNIGNTQACNANTRNYTDAQGSIVRCDLYTTAANKSHSQVYLSAKAFHDDFSKSLGANTFESNAVQSVPETLDGLTYAYIPSIADVVSDKLGYDALPERFYLKDTAYTQHLSNTLMGLFSKTSPKQYVCETSACKAKYPKYIAYTWGKQSGKAWEAFDASVFSHLNSSNILYAINSDIHKNSLFRFCLSSII